MKRYSTIAACGALCAASIIFFFACGSDDEAKNTTTATSYSFTSDINPILVASCGGSTCHSSTAGAPSLLVGNEANFKTYKTQVIEKINKSVGEAGVMPPADATTVQKSSFTSDSRQKLIDFLNQ